MLLFMVDETIIPNARFHCQQESDITREMFEEKAKPGHESLELLIQKRFSTLRRSGEWFGISDELLAFIDGVVQGLNPVALLLGVAA